MKKILSIVLALTMLIGCSLPASAAVNAEMCEFCEDGTVVWETDWIREREPFAYASCDIHPNGTYSIYREYRIYACRDCGEIAHTQWHNTYVCTYDPDVPHEYDSDSWLEFP